MIHIRKRNWIRNYKLDDVVGRVQIGFFRCPVCREYIGMYTDEFSKQRGKSFRNIKCINSICNFNDTVMLDEW